jgi:hypothetical protein
MLDKCKVSLILLNPLYIDRRDFRIAPLLRFSLGLSTDFL